MKRPLLALLLALPLGACLPAARSPSQALAKAESVIDAFYSFDDARLAAAMAPAAASLPRIGYYQGWAQGGHYRIVSRKPCRFVSRREIACDITVKDDLIAALGTGYDVTDTFHFRVSGAAFDRVWTSSNDPKEFDEALDWVKRERANLVAVPCTGFFDGGPTPGDCVRAVVRGFAEYAAQRGASP